MSGPGQVTMALPRPGPALKVVLIVIGAIGLLEQVVSTNHIDAGVRALRWLVCSAEDGKIFQAWRLVTSGVLTNPASLNHLVFTMLGLYFLSPDLERRWGGARFVRFLVTSVVLGNLFSLAGAALFAESPKTFLGADAALAAIAVAWSREYPDAQVRLFFFLPVSGRAFLWITAASAMLGFVYPNSIPAGPAAPVAGILVGLALAGTPSAVRKAYLQLRLRSLGRRAAEVARTEPDLRPGAPPRKTRSNAPPLRVVPYSGLEEELKKRKPPKDKRYLN